MSADYDIIIIGAGPAGMAAAVTATDNGASVLVLDEQVAPGGQIYRAIEANAERNRTELGQSYHDGAPLAAAFRAGRVRYLSGTSVWQVSGDGEVGYTRNGTARLVRAHHVIIATGAQERPMPVPGWTKPGVMTVGAAQILLKEAGLGVENAVFAGTGPLFYLTIQQFVHAGIPVKAAIDLTPRANYAKAARHLPAAMGRLGRIVEGWKWKRRIAASGIPFIRNVDDLRVTGGDACDGVEYRKSGHWHRVEAAHVLLHQGVVPNVNLAMATGCDFVWDERAACMTVKVDPWFQTSLPGIWVTGDGTAVTGALAAEHGGAIAAYGVLEQLDRIDKPTRDAKSAPHRKTLTAERRLRPFLDTLFRPADRFRIPPDDDTIVCRCEEVTAGTIKEVATMGCAGPNQLKSFSRCGMGPCQGRFCGLTVSELIGRIEGKPVSEIGYYRLRPPIKPLRLEELAALETGTEASE